MLNILKGEFCNGDITGKGKMILPDLSYYQGDFFEGLFHGNGIFYISSTFMLYSGGWKAGKKHGINITYINYYIFDDYFVN